jgi:hypothetical protein
VISDWNFLLPYFFAMSVSVPVLYNLLIGGSAEEFDGAVVIDPASFVKEAAWIVI